MDYSIQIIFLRKTDRFELSVTVFVYFPCFCLFDYVSSTVLVSVETIFADTYSGKFLFTKHTAYILSYSCGLKTCFY